MPETLRAYGIWDLDSDMPEVIPGVRNVDFFHSVAIQDPMFLSLQSKKMIPTSVETLPWSHNTIYLDDESPIERGNGLCSIPEFVPLCNQMFRRSMCMLAAHTYKKFPVREEDMYTKGKEGVPIALLMVRDSILSVYRLRFSCVDGLVSRRTVTTSRASAASMETIKRHCTNCITTRAWQIERGIKEVMDSGATMDRVMR